MLLHVPVWCLIIFGLNAYINDMNKNSNAYMLNKFVYIFVVFCGVDKYVWVHCRASTDNLLPEGRQEYNIFKTNARKQAQFM